LKISCDEKCFVPKKVSAKLKKRVKKRCLMCKCPQNDVLAIVWKFRNIQTKRRLFSAGCPER